MTPEQAADVIGLLDIAVLLLRVICSVVGMVLFVIGCVALFGKR